MTNNKIDILENIELFSLDDLEQNKQDFSDEENNFFEVSSSVETETISISNFDNEILNEKVEKETIQEEIIEMYEETIQEEIEKIKSETTDYREENIKETIVEKKSNFIENILFFFKYITTSALIFIVLLATTNYSAYTNIAKSYFFKEEMQRTEVSIISSVEAAKITTTIKEKKEILKKIASEDKNTEKSKYSIKKLASGVSKADFKLDIEITPYENRIIIPKIWKNIPMLDIKNQTITWPKELENIFMKELENGIIRYPGSTKPWKEWNTFVFWHSSNFPWIKWDYNDVFSLLDNVSYGDEIIMYYDQKKYVYKIKEKKVITPWDVEILKRDNKKDELTLMTCWPIWTTLNRLIVIWEFVEEKDEKIVKNEEIKEI